MQYTYVDGNGNRYSVQNAILRYDPMTPELSSSGSFSGGQPFTKELEKIELIKMVDVFERALWSEFDHSEKRTLGSGSLIKIIGGESQGIYLKRNSSSMIEINTVLEMLHSNK